MIAQTVLPIYNLMDNNFRRSLYVLELAPLVEDPYPLKSSQISSNTDKPEYPVLHIEDTHDI